MSSRIIDRPPAPGWTRPPTTEVDGRALVLYVDMDDESYSEAIERLGHAYKLLRVRQDRAACKAIREHHAKLVAIMLDVDMPGSVLDGVLLTRILRGSVPAQAIPPFARELPTMDIPIILVTQNLEHYSDREMVRQGGDRLMLKPVEIHKLTLTLTEWHLQRLTADGRSPRL